MPPKRGLSRDDKLIAMQELMMESRDVWTLKDLERDCPKKKGIVQQSVKEILQELCDSDLISTDRIGISNFFWCFPSEAYSRRKVQLTKFEAQIAEAEREIAALETEIASLASTRIETNERLQLNHEIAEMEAKMEFVNREIVKYDRMNPLEIKRIERQSGIALNAVNRWTDNFFTLRSWAMKEFGLTPRRFDESFEISQSLDYLT
jgi:hypothetical protein